MTRGYYNDNDPYCAAWLRNLTAAGVLLNGHVDERSILDVEPSDLASYRHVHLFAGIGGWAHALDLASWPADRPVWTVSCPCQPLSSAGNRRAEADERHLWPAVYRLVAERRPTVILGEQVASRLGREWFSGVRADLEYLGYAVGCAGLPAASVGAPHIRQRLFWLAHASVEGLESRPGRPQPRGVRVAEPSDLCRVGDASAAGLPLSEQDDVRGARRRSQGRAVAEPSDAPRGLAESDDTQRRSRGVDREDGRDGADDGRAQTHRDPGACGEVRGLGLPQGAHEPCAGGMPWSDAVWLPCADGKARRTQSSVLGVVDGLSGYLGRGGSINETLFEVRRLLGGDERLFAAALLFAAMLRQLSDCEGNVAEQWEKACSEAFRRDGMSALWERAKSSAASQGRKSAEQLPKQHRNSLPRLPQGYARYVWDLGFWNGTDKLLCGLWQHLRGEGSPLTGENLLPRMPERMGTPLCDETLANRTGRLRAYGNAIVPQVAAEFIRAVMECVP